MRHRIATSTGFGNPEPAELDNNSILRKTPEMDAFMEQLATVLSLVKEWGGFDYHVDDDSFDVGIEPAYEGDKLQIVHFDLTDKNKCAKILGRAFGPYGSNVCRTCKCYGDYAYKSKFVRFVDDNYSFIKQLAEEMK